MLMRAVFEAIRQGWPQRLGCWAVPGNRDCLETRKTLECPPCHSGMEAAALITPQDANERKPRYAQDADAGRSIAAGGAAPGPHRAGDPFPGDDHDRGGPAGGGRDLCSPRAAQVPYQPIRPARPQERVQPPLAGVHRRVRGAGRRRRCRPGRESRDAGAGDRRDRRPVAPRARMLPLGVLQDRSGQAPEPKGCTTWSPSNCEPSRPSWPRPTRCFAGNGRR